MNKQLPEQILKTETKAYNYTGEVGGQPIV